MAINLPSPRQDLIDSVDAIITELESNKRPSLDVLAVAVDAALKLGSKGLREGYLTINDGVEVFSPASLAQSLSESLDEFESGDSEKGLNGISVSLTWLGLINDTPPSSNAAYVRVPKVAEVKAYAKALDSLSGLIAQEIGKRLDDGGLDFDLMKRSLDWAQRDPQRANEHGASIMKLADVPTREL